MIVVFEIAGVLIFATVMLAEAIRIYLMIRDEDIILHGTGADDALGVIHASQTKNQEVDKAP